MRSRTLLLAGLFGFIALRAATLTAANGESVAAEFGASHLRIQEPVGIYGPFPYLLREVDENDLIQLQVTYPIAPPFPQHIEAKVANRALSALWIAGTDAQVVTLMPAPQSGNIGVGFISVYLKANSPGQNSAEVSVTLSDGTKKTVPFSFHIFGRNTRKDIRPAHVKTILNVEYAIEESNPPTLVVTAVGQVPTLGWKDAELIRRVYVAPPADGIWDYDLYAVPPAGLALQALSVVRADDRWVGFDRGSVKGVRVHGEGAGVKEVRFESRAAATSVNKTHVYAYPVPLKATDKLSDGPNGKPLSVVDGTQLVWIDFMPDARYVHPTMYLLINGREARAVKGDWWPVLNGNRILLDATAPLMIRGH